MNIADHIRHLSILAPEAQQKLTLTPREFSIIVTLYNLGDPCVPRQLAARIEITPKTASNYLAVLHKKGYLGRTNSGYSNVFAYFLTTQIRTSCVARVRLAYKAQQTKESQP